MTLKENSIGHGLKVLSLFDGMSCGMLALERAGIKVDTYYASEIDKYAIQVSQKNYPDIIQLGDVNNWRDWDLGEIDMIIGGSPCQGFSFAGKQLAFDDPRSKLFFTMVDIINHYKPKYFLLENVKMKKEFQDVISEYLGVQPIEINSALVSAQNRKRLYWTNIPNIIQPENKNIHLKDILDDVVDDSLFLSDTIASRYFPINCTINNNKSCVIGKLSNHQGDRIFDINCKGSSLSASGGNNGAGGCNIIFDPKSNKLRKLSIFECERLQTVPKDYTKTAKKTQRYKMLGNGWTVDVIAHILGGLTYMSEK